MARRRPIRRRRVRRRSRRMRTIRRVPRRSMRGMRRSQLINVSFKSCAQATVAVGAVTYNGIAIRLDDYTAAPQFKLCFDQFRIRKIHYELRPRGNVVNVFGSGATSGVSGRIIHAVDPDDNTLWANLSDAINSWGARTSRWENGFKRYFTPSVQNAMKMATGSTTFVDNPKKSPWLSVSAGSTSHYGIKFVTILEGTAQTTTTVDIMQHIYVQFRHRKH